MADLCDILSQMYGVLKRKKKSKVGKITFAILFRRRIDLKIVPGCSPELFTPRKHDFPKTRFFGFFTTRLIFRWFLLVSSDFDQSVKYLRNISVLASSTSKNDSKIQNTFQNHSESPGTIKLCQGRSQITSAKKVIFLPPPHPPPQWRTLHSYLRERTLDCLLRTAFHT